MAGRNNSGHSDYSLEWVYLNDGVRILERIGSCVVFTLRFVGLHGPYIRCLGSSSYAKWLGRNRLDARCLLDLASACYYFEYSWINVYKRVSV